MTGRSAYSAFWKGLRPPYTTIVADPPWRYRTTNPTTGAREKGSSAENHYPTMTNADIAALPVADLAAPDAHCYLWVTNPRMFGERRSREIGPVDILDAWGFRYITLLTWIKTGPPGMGYYFRGNTEHVLFGIRGKAPIPPHVRERNHFTSPRTRHSQKPDVFFDLVERVSEPRYLELFARSPRPGWDAWGNEVSWMEGA